MELSPKQQAVNEIKNAKRVLVLGHKKPDGDHLGSLLALGYALEKIDKNVELLVSDNTDKRYHFLPDLAKVKNSYQHSDGKILKIDTNRIPISGMKWQREETFLKIYLETDRNLKFEFIEIENGQPKPDLIIVIDTPGLEHIDKAYEKNTELFFEVPILNIDHHPGNDYFGTINLVDLTATSTAEILVSLFEALGVKIDSPDMATCLLTGLLDDTESFRGKNITPKSLTVAAQLLAAGGRQQEIISSFYKTEPTDLIRIWNIMLANTAVDQARKLAWTKIDLTPYTGLTIDDSFEAAGDLLKECPDAETIILFAKDKKVPNIVMAQASGRDDAFLKNIAKVFGTEVKEDKVIFELKCSVLDDAENLTLKKIAEKLTPDIEGHKELWDVMEEAETIDLPPAQKEPTIVQDKRPRLTSDETPRSVKEKEDAIEEALKSISQVEKDINRKEFVSLRDVIDRKKAGGMRVIETVEVIASDEEIFEDE